MFMRAVAVICVALSLCGASKPDAEMYLDQLLTSWQKDPDFPLRFRISGEPIIGAMIVWDEDGQRTYPQQGVIPHVSEEAILTDIGRLNALRASASLPAWEQITRDSDFYYRCSALRCISVNGPALMEAIGDQERTLAELLAADQPKAPFMSLGFFAAALIALIAFYLRRRKNTPQAASISDKDSFAFGAARIDPNHMTATVGSHANPLTARDLKIIALFRENQGVVLTKDQLYDAGWGRDYLPNSRALEQHILTLRRKLNPDRTSPEAIETVHGQGYRYKT